MKKYPNAYITHYSKLTERKSRIKNDLSHWPAKVEFIEEFNKEDITEKIKEKYKLKDKKDYSKEIKSLARNNINGEIISDSEMSLALKHLHAYKKIIDNDEEYGLVLEDDAIPKDNFIEKFMENIKNTPVDWDMIFMGEGCGIKFIKEKIKKGHKINEFCYEVKGTNGTEAYLIKKEIAQKLINSMEKFVLPVDWEIEHQLQNMDVKVIWWFPSLFYQGSENGIYKSSLR